MGIRACTLSQVAECRGTRSGMWFLWTGKIPNKKRWVREWNDSVDYRTIKNELCAVSKQLMAVHQKKSGTQRQSGRVTVGRRVDKGRLGAVNHVGRKTRHRLHQNVANCITSDCCRICPRPSSRPKLQMSTNGGWCLAYLC